MALHGPTPDQTFFTAFPADADNSGFATAPGATVSVTNKTINVSVPNGANIYLAWNYSVISGTTTTNAQALAIDNISVLGIGNADSNQPERRRARRIRIRCCRAKPRR